MKGLVSILLVLPLVAWGKLSPLAPAPDWSKLEVFQETMTQDDFVALLDKVYAPSGEWRKYISISDKSAVIRTSSESSPILLRFAPSRSQAKDFSTYWRTRADLPPVEPGKPLAGLKIALDPGHIGGSWAKIEERWFQLGNGKPVVEGDMTLLVAKNLAPQLEKLGAEVFLTRNRSVPSTSLRPKELAKAAAASLADKGEPATREAVQEESERLFYRVAEIRRRAKTINEDIRPDVVLCLHFNAEEWGDEKNPILVDDSHLHLLVYGDVSPKELAYDDQRFDMLVKLLNRSYAEELRVTTSLASSLSKATGLPPYLYRQSNAIRVNSNPYIWARDLLANRLFTCPVAYVEPYVMNSRLAYARIQAGDYDGLRSFGGMMRKSIFREYADALAAGLLAYYSNRPL